MIMEAHFHTEFGVLGGDGNIFMRISLYNDKL